MPFDLLIGYTPQIHQPTRKTNVLTLEQQLSHISEARSAAQEAQRKAQDSWVTDRPRFTPFEVGTKVWLEGTNLRHPSNLTPKLAPKWYGPFEIAAQISKVAYKLKLPPTWKIYDIFHASLLTPYKETLQHRPNFLELPPEITEGELEWEVKKIIKERTFGRWKKKQYLVRWKGYSPSHNEWVPEEDLHAPDLLTEFQKQSSSIRTLSLDATIACPLCYNPPTNFSFLPSSGPPSTQPAVPPPQPISTAPAPAPPAPLAFNPFHTSYLPLYNVTDFYEHPQGYAQLQQPLGSPHRQPLLPSPDPDAEMSSPTHASSSIDHYGLLQPPSPRDDPMEGTPPSDHLPF